MKVKEILDKKGYAVYKINEDATAADAVKELKTHKVGSLFVMNGDSELVGFISERDLLYKCHERGTNPKETKIKDLFTPIDNLIIGTLTDNTTYLMRVMTQRKIRHIPILDKEKIVGLISIGDVIKAMLEDSEQEARMLREFVQNPYGISIL